MAHTDRFAAFHALFVCGLSTDGTGLSLCLEEQVADAPVKADRQDFKWRPLETPSHPDHDRDCDEIEQVIDWVAQPQGVSGLDLSAAEREPKRNWPPREKIVAKNVREESELREQSGS